MVINFKKAFTLVEAVMSMIIIMIVTTTLVPVLTKVNPKVESTTLRGQYACWTENGQLKEQYMDERTARRPAQAVTNCKFHLDQRPAMYYIIASGAGSNNVQGQTVTKYASGIASDLDISLGRIGGDPITLIKSSDTGLEEVRAMGGEYFNSQIIPLNIIPKSCRLLTAGQPCSNISGQYQESCEIVEVLGDNNATSGYKDYRIRINGCDAQDEYGYVSRDNLIEFNDLTYSSSQLFVGNNATEALINSIANANNNYFYYGNVKLNFKFNDSSYYSNGQNISKMSEIIDMISVQRKSDLTKLLSDLKPGAPNKNGAVLILW